MSNKYLKIETLFPVEFQMGERVLGRRESGSWCAYRLSELQITHDATRATVARVANEFRRKITNEWAETDFILKAEITKSCETKKISKYSFLIVFSNFSIFFFLTQEIVMTLIIFIIVIIIGRRRDWVLIDSR